MHRKRHAAPKRWRLPGKAVTWAPAPAPGPHSTQNSVPLRIVLRDMIEVADSTREVKRIAAEGLVMVDGIVRRDEKFAVGMFDVVTVGDEAYRLLVDRKNRFVLREAEDPDLKPVKVVDATTVNAGRRQMHLSSGHNIEGDAPTGATLVMRVPENEPEAIVEREPGKLAFITGGKHAGQIATVEAYDVVRSSNPNRVTLKEDGEVFSTVEDYVFMIGDSEPEVSL
ncbi:MAG: 30S ribosomal protein S4e [Methanonatronarchaeales archaeon]|nr:30S ribosomal protein S4e [Methanonatronarchaeales archaeon]